LITFCLVKTAGVMMLRNFVRNAQRVLRARAGYAGDLDGVPGPASLAAAYRVDGVLGQLGVVSPSDIVIAAAQAILEAEGFNPGPVDGKWGVRTDGAYLEWRAAGLGVPFLDRSLEADFGRQADVVRRFGDAGSAACTSGKVVMPWRTVLAWDRSQVITSFSCHEMVAPSAQRALDRIAETHSAVQIRHLGLHLFGGCYNYRPMRGGKALSMHAWGLAIDFDPARNRLTWSGQRARLGQPDASAFWSIWEAEGWTSLGRARGYDWMHVQAPAL
jgi:hypothetical protein